MFIDHATDENIRLWEVNCEVHRRGMELIRPGAKCKDVALELNEIYRKHDLLKYRTFGYGHSFGTMCHYYGREAGKQTIKKKFKKISTLSFNWLSIVGNETRMRHK